MAEDSRFKGAPPRGGMRPLVLAAAMQTILARGTPPEPKLAASLADELRARGTPLNGLKIAGVPEGHEHYPPAKTFNVVGNTCYVRDVDFPALKAALDRQRAKRRGPSMPMAPGMAVSKRETDEP